MMKIVLASSNQGKLIEIQETLKGFPVSLINQTDLNIPDADETASTYVENALIKARQATELSGLPALADDSGISIDALDGAPGVYSSRYAPTDTARIEKVLTALKETSSENRHAQFHSAIVLLMHPKDPAPIICHGVWEGSIVTEAKGEAGFGYDPIFHVPEYHCTAAELSMEIKNTISHRAIALAQLKTALLRKL